MTKEEIKYRIAIGEMKYRIAKAEEIISKLLEEEKNNMYWEMNGSNKSSYYEVKAKAEQFLEEIKEK